MEFLSIGKKEKVLIIAPHPDDECIGVGGILCKYPHNCTVALLSMGEQGQGKERLDYTRGIREQEFIEEMKLAGIDDYQFLNYPDGQLLFHLNMLDDFDLSKYSKIFVTSNKDNHPDHTAAYICLTNALRKQNHNAEVYAYEIHNPLANPTHCLDITADMKKKEELISAHRSQIDVFPYDKYAYIAGLYRGMLLRNPNALYEVYELVNLDEKEEGFDNVEKEKEIQKFKQFYWVLTRWIELKDQGSSVLDGIKDYSKVAVYGYAEMGKLLTKEIEKNNKFKLMYIFDKKYYGKDGVVYPAPDIEKPDCVIVTAIASFDVIKKELEMNGYKNVISLKELVVKEKSIL